VTVTAKDFGAGVLTALVVLVFLATHEGWGVPLIGDSRRWAAGAIMLLGVGTCALGAPGRDAGTKLLAALGIMALVLLIVALATASLTVLSLLVADVVLLWVGSTLRHTLHVPRKPISA